MYNAKPTIAYALRNDATLLALIPESQMFDGVAVWPGEVKYPYLVYSELANVEGLQADDGEVETEVTFRIYLYSKTSLSTIYQNIDRIMGIELDFERNYARDNDEMLGTEIIIRSKIMSYTNTFINDLSGAPVYPDVTFEDTDEIDFTYNGQTITAELKVGSVKKTKLSDAVKASLVLADSAFQGVANTFIIAESGGDYTTIQAALDANATADTLFIVYPGTYVGDTIVFTANNQYVTAINVSPRMVTLTKATNICDFGEFTNCIVKDIKMVMTLGAGEFDTTVKGNGSCSFKFCHTECIASGTIGAGTGATVFQGTGEFKIVEGSIIYTNNADRGGRGKKAILVESGSKYVIDDVTFTVTGSGTSLEISAINDKADGEITFDKCTIDVTDNESLTTYGLNIDTAEGYIEVLYNSIHATNNTNNATIMRLGSNGGALKLRSMYNHLHAVAGSGIAYSFDIEDADVEVVSQFDDIVALGGVKNDEGGSYAHVNSQSDGNFEISGNIAYTALSADPSDPADGESVTWLSDGTESGNAGDLMMKITVGAITRTKTVVEF